MYTHNHKHTHTHTCIYIYIHTHTYLCVCVENKTTPNSKTLKQTQGNDRCFAPRRPKKRASW